MLLFPDTNIFVHYRSLDDFDWEEISEGLPTVVITIPVVRELDRLKADRRVGGRAKEVLAWIEQRFSTGEEAVLRSGPRVVLDFAPTLKTFDFETLGLDPRHGDDRILAAALSFDRGRDSDRALMSDDAAMRLRARALGLHVVRPPPQYRLVGGDPAEAELARVTRQLEQLQRALPDLTVRFVEGGTVLQVPRTRPRVGKLGARGIEEMLLPLDVDNLPIVYSMGRTKPTHAEVERYNEELQKLQPAFDAYFRARFEHETFPYRSVRLQLLFANSGGKPAEGNEITLILPEACTAVGDDEVPAEPVQPKLPKLPGRSLFDPLEEAHPASPWV